MMEKLIEARCTRRVKQDRGFTRNVVLGESPKVESRGINETDVKVLGNFGDVRAQGKI